MKKTMYLIDVEKNKAEVVEADGLNDFYKLINCDTIDIVNRKIGNKRYDIICDGNGLYAAQPKISAIDNHGNVMLVGNILISGLADENGNLTSLTEYDIAYISKRVQRMCTRLFPDGYMMLTQCDY